MPGVRVTSVRRTVVVAVTLVTAQALLGGVIGFVTFGGDRDAPAAPVAEPQLAGPPVVLPPPSISAPAERLSAASSRAVRTERPASPPASAAVRSPATRTSSPPPATSEPPEPALPPMPPISDTDPDRVAPSVPAPVPGEDTPVPVAGEPCDEAGATGQTADDKAVRCLRGRDGELRWRLV